MTRLDHTGHDAQRGDGSNDRERTTFGGSGGHAPKVSARAGTT
ncbi:MAG TPA: hypothetical protein VF128_14695 [Gemmatimonadaceae bacterium]